MNKDFRVPLLFLLTICLLPSWLRSQTPFSNQRSKSLVISNGCYQLDTLTIIPSSVQVLHPDEGVPIAGLLYRVSNSEICFFRTDSTQTAVLIRYKVLPYQFGKALFRMDTALWKKSDAVLDGGLTYSAAPNKSTEALSFGNLDYNGSFVRGISFGNNQDLVLNSNFNLQMAGKLGDGIDLLAAITDQNIPLQPAGNTRQLREFDRVFFQLSKGRGKLIAGDFDLLRPKSYFLNYFKRLQGLSFSIQSPNSPKGTWSGNSGLAVSRGQFARNQIQAIEGNQGPYRLRGNAGEQFVIVLAGTEKVWLDGYLLVRGIETDYIIDYNRGEVTFTNRRLITKDSRIIIEFEYSDQNYLRSLYAFNAEFQKKQTRFYANLFGQQDSRTSIGLNPLTPGQRQILANAGDDLSAAVSTSVDLQSDFQPYRAQYLLVDTLTACGLRDSVLIFSTDPNLARYTARFSQVGQGRGNYKLDAAFVANERVYRWSPPDPTTCAPTGDYEPVIQLVAPQQHQMFALGAEQQFAPKSSLKTELAISRKDLNRFSAIDRNDDFGGAIFSNFKHSWDIGSDSSGWHADAEAAYEWVHRHFRPLNPYRDPEFLRDWSLTDIQGIGTVPRATENLGRASMTIRKKDLGSLQYAFSGFLRDTSYQGTRHAVQMQINPKKWQVQGDASLLNANVENLRNEFLRPRLQISRNFKNLGGWRAGVLSQSERNERRNILTDALAPNSFYFNLVKAFAERTGPREKFFWATHFQRRQDYAPFMDDFSRNTRADEWNFNGSRSFAKGVTWSGNLTWRQLDIQNASLTNQQAARNFLGRSDLQIAAWKGAFQSNTTYEAGSGQEPRLEFTFVRVRQGEGTHIWLDSLNNNDGIIQPNEMEPAPFPDLADFVRVPANTNNFVRVDFAHLLQSIQLEPRAVWFNATGVRQFLSKFALQSTLKTERRTRQSSEVEAWNPLQWNIPDSALVAITSAVRHILFFNRGHPKWDIQTGYSDNWNKVVQTTGYEDRRTREQFLRARLNISKAVTAQFATMTSLRESDSEFFNNRDYQIASFVIEQEFSWLYSSQFRLSTRYKFQTDDNILREDGEFAQRHDLSMESLYNKAGGWALRNRLTFADIQFQGATNSPVGFAILNGLQRGKNWLWSAGFDRQVAKNLQIGISYEGRRTGSGRVIHLGRASVGAVF